MSPHDALDHLSPVVDRMPPIRNVERTRRARLATRRVGLTAVARDDCDARSCFQPCLKGLSIPIR